MRWDQFYKYHKAYKLVSFTQEGYKFSLRTYWSLKELKLSQQFLSQHHPYLYDVHTFVRYTNTAAITSFIILHNITTMSTI